MSQEPIDRPPLLRSALFALALATGLVITLNTVSQSNGSSPSLGQMAPTIEWKTLEGTARSLSDLRNRVVLLHFWANWCYPCLQEMPSLAQLEGMLGSKPFSVLAFHVEAIRRDQLNSLPIRDFPKNLVIDFDREQLGVFNVSSIPISFLVDKTGRLRKIFRGPQEWRSEQLQRIIETLINEDNSTESPESPESIGSTH